MKRPCHCAALARSAERQRDVEAAGRRREGGDDHVPVPRRPSSTDASLGYAARLRISRRDSATDQAGPLQNKTECSGSTQSERKSVGSLSTHSTQCILTAMGKSSAVSAASQRFSSITRPIDGGGSISHAIVLRTGQLPLRLTKLCASLQGASQPCMQPQEFHAVTSLTSTSRLESNRRRYTC